MKLHHQQRPMTPKRMNIQATIQRENGNASFLFFPKVKKPNKRRRRKWNSIPINSSTRSSNNTEIRPHPRRSNAHSTPSTVWKREKAKRTTVNESITSAPSKIASCVVESTTSTITCSQPEAKSSPTTPESLWIK